jgi:hypothetical protein
MSNACVRPLRPRWQCALNEAEFEAALSPLNVMRCPERER